MSGIPAAASRIQRVFLPEAFDAWGVGLIYWDLEAGTFTANERFAELTGIGPGAVDHAFERLLERLNPDDRDSFVAARGHLLEGGEEVHSIRRFSDATDRERWVEGWIRPVKDAAGSVVALAGAFADVTGLRSMQVEREEQGEWISRLQRVTAALAVAGDVEDVVEIVSGPVAEAVGGRHASVRLLSSDGSTLVVAGWTGPEAVALPPVGIEEEMPIALAARTGEAIFDWTIGDIIERFPKTRELARLAGASEADLAIAVPLRAPRRVIGVLAVTLPADIPWTDHRREFLLAAASQAAQVVERARAFEAEQRAHREAEDARGRVEFLSEVTELLSSSADVDDTLRRLAKLSVPRLADWCFVELVDGGEFRNVATAGVDAELTAWVAEFRGRFSPSGTFYRPAIESGQARLYPEITAEDLRRIGRSDLHLANLTKLDALSSIVAPLVIDGEAVGVINLVTGRSLSGRSFDNDDLELAEEVARRAAVALDNAMLHASERSARIGAEEVARRVTRLQRVTSALAGAVSRENVVEAMLAEAVGAVGARDAMLYAVDGVGSLRVLGKRDHGARDAGAPWIAQEEVDLDLRLQQVTEAVERKTVVWTHSSGENAAEPPIGHPCAVVPLLLEERVIGVFYLGFETRGDESQAERDFLLTIGRQCAQALERSRLYEEEQGRREFEAKLRRRMQHLHAIAQAGLEHLRLDDSLQLMLELVIDAVGADVGAALLEDSEGRGPMLRAVYDEEPSDPSAPPVRAVTSIGVDRPIDVTSTPLESVLAGTALEDPDLGDVAIPPHRRGRVRSIVALPLRISGRVLGSLHVASVMPGHFGTDEVDLVRLAAEQVAIAVDRAQLFEREHRIAEVLQRSLLPERLPELRGMELAARYLPGSAESQVGGDWYEVLELPDGQVAMAVGDVVGSGVPAAATMGQFRNAMRALALEGLGVGRVLERLNELALGLEGEFATALLMTLDPASGMLRYASAGHPPALVLHADGQTALLLDANATPLGVEPGTAYLEAVHPLEPGDTVVLYTDGLIERRDESLDRGLERLRRVAPGGGDVEVLVSRLVDGLAPLDVRDDDIAIMALRYMARPVRFELSLPPVAASVAAFRTALSGWLEEQHVPEADSLDIILAVSEVCSNAIEHAGGSSAEVRLMVELRGGDAMVSIRDGGRWRPPSARPERGRGFLILRHVMDSVDVRRRRGGTEVRMHRRVGKNS